MTDAILGSFSKSITRLAEVLKEPKTVVTRDSAIKRFELTFELAWKSVKKRLEGTSVACQSPRDCFAEAFRLGLGSDNPLWLKMIDDRNLSVHTYNEKLADEIYGRLKDYLLLFARLSESLKK